MVKWLTRLGMYFLCIPQIFSKSWVHAYRPNVMLPTFRDATEVAFRLDLGPAVQGRL